MVVLEDEASRAGGPGGPLEVFLKHSPVPVSAPPHLPSPTRPSVVPPTLARWHVCKEHNNNHAVMWRKQLKTAIFHVAPC